MARLATSPRYRWFVVAAMWAIHFIYFSTYSSVGALGPLLKEDLALSNTQFGMLCGAIGAGTTLAQLPGGMWADRIGVRNVIALSFAGIGVAALVFSVTGGFASGCVVLFALGLAVGCSQIAGTKSIVDWFPTDGRATAMGIKQTGVNAGGTLASFLLPLIAGLFGWRFLYRGVGVSVFIAALLFFLLYRDPRRVAHPSMSLADSVRTGSRALRSRHFLLITIVGLFLIAVQFSFSSYLVLYVNQHLRLPLTFAGSMLAVSFAAGAAGRIGWGVAGDYLFKSRELSMVVITIIGLLVCITLACLTSSTPVWLLYVLAVVAGITMLGWNGVWLSLVGEAAMAYSAGFAIGLCFLFANLGLFLGPPLFGLLSDLFHSFAVSWLLLAFCLAVVSSVMILEVRAQRT